MNKCDYLSSIGSEKKAVSLFETASILFMLFTSCCAFKSLYLNISYRLLFIHRECLVLWRWSRFILYLLHQVIDGRH